MTTLTIDFKQNKNSYVGNVDVHNCDFMNHLTKYFPVNWLKLVTTVLFSVLSRKIANTVVASDAEAVLI